MLPLLNSVINFPDSTSNILITDPLLLAEAIFVPVKLKQRVFIFPLWAFLIILVLSHKLNYILF